MNKINFDAFNHAFTYTEQSEVYKDFKTNANIFFLICNFLGLKLDKMKGCLDREYKLAANRLIDALKVFNRLSERVLKPEQMDEMDQDANILNYLVEAEIIAFNLGKKDEFLNHINNFFNELMGKEAKEQETQGVKA